MDERLQFVARRLAGEPMAELCREFGISRKTGYKIFDRYQECGIHGLTDRSRRPYRYANQLPFQVENFILNVKREHPSWGTRKIRERLLRRFSGIPIPAKSTVHVVLDRHGLVERRGRVRRRAQGTALSLGQRPNELWCTDYKGEFLLGNRQYCYPLTVTDHASRFLLTCEALSSTREDYAFTVFERLFQERGLPVNIRSDNGVPFASAHALFHLSKLAVWWLRLGIGIERIKPGHPQQNGRHERRDRCGVKLRDLARQTDKGSEFIGGHDSLGRRTGFPAALGDRQHLRIPPAAHTYQWSKTSSSIWELSLVVVNFSPKRRAIRTISISRDRTRAK
jgi:transposase InsO family protein